MSKYDVREIRRLYDRGENIVSWIKAQENAANPSSTAILYSYDAQAGTYISHVETPDGRELRERIGERLGAILSEIAPLSLLEAGVGEATSLTPVLRHIRSKPRHVLGFDLSLSRLLFAREYLRRNETPDVELFTGDLERIPLASASVDTIVTIHVVEPNGGREEAILSELLRVAGRYLVLIEPSYEFASAEARARMERLGYVRALPETLTRLGYEPRKVERWPHNSNPLNEAALIVVEKTTATSESQPQFVSPLSGGSLLRRPDCLFCAEDGHAFPIISGIPCLTTDNAVLASKLNAL